MSIVTSQMGNVCLTAKNLKNRARKLFLGRTGTGV